MNNSEDFLNQFPPTNINSDPIIDFIDGKKLTKEDIGIASLFSNLYISSTLNKKRYKFYRIIFT